jgi:myosin heavy subunit
MLMCVQLKDQHGSSPAFVKPKFGTETFGVVHFADTVTYEIDGFLAKNTDAAPAAITEVYTRPLTDRQAASLGLRTCLLGS